MPKQFLFILIFLLLNSFFYSQTKPNLNTEIEKLKSDDALKHAIWSICVMPVDKDTVLTEYNSSISLIPASTLKIITTGAALSTLGSDFKFETQIRYDGVFDAPSGTINGNLYIIGGGDPTLESAYFKDSKDSTSITDKWAALLKEKGIKKITGSIIGDASVFDNNTIPAQWIWADIGNYFGAGASGLTYHDNKYTLYLKSGVVGSNTTITKTLPVIDGLQFVNTVTAGGKGDNAFIYGGPYSNYRIMQGTIPANKNDYELDGSIPDPALLCAQSLEQSLKSIGISVNANATTVRVLKETNKYISTEKYLLYTNYSPTLGEIVYWTNFKSINLFAEHLLKYLAYTKNGTGTEDAGTELVVDFWKKKGIDVNGLFMNDGCGLSRSNVITTKIETEVLRLMTQDKNFQKFYDSFPVSGEKGSLEKMCEHSYAKNNLCAKSGYITRARGYAGYVKNRKGKMLCFSVLANNYDCSPVEMKNKLEKLMIAIAEME
jgi:D-alanyl-D-alanine carboxypeptidase/D-alanyl-D-alanine-endopeptidase (penicillin-binding protein 4)